MSCVHENLPRTVKDWESAWLAHLLSEAGPDLSEAERLAIAMQAFSWAHQMIHGRGLPPAEVLWRELALKLGASHAFSRVFIPLPPHPWELLT